MTDYYVRPSNGDNANAGTSFAAAFATTAKVITVEAAGDTIFFCNEADEVITTSLSTTATGSRDSPIKWIAGNSTDGSPLNGSGEYTWATNLSSGNDGLIVNSGDTYRFFQDMNLEATGGSKDEGWKIQDQNNTLVRCSAKGGWVEGFNVEDNILMIDCESSGNGVGFSGDSRSTFMACRAHDNTGIGFTTKGGSNRYMNCASYDNGGDGYDQNTEAYCVYDKCLAFNNTGDGFDVGDAVFVTIINCTSSSNTGYGYNYTASGIWTITFGFNHGHGNSSGSTPTNETGDWADQGLGGNIDGDPLFTSVVDGSEDFTPATGSPLIDSGFPEKWGATTVGNMGPLKEAAGGGGDATQTYESHARGIRHARAIISEFVR